MDSRHRNDRVNELPGEYDMALKMHEIFGSYCRLKANMSKEDLKYEILINQDIDWDEVSAIPTLPEFIMYEFRYQLNWKIILFHRPMNKKTIRRFEKYLLDAAETPNIIDDLSKILLKNPLVTSEMINAGFMWVCHNNRPAIVESLLKTSLITSEMINKGFLWVCRNNGPAIVELLLKTTLVTPQMIDDEFSYACRNLRLTIVKHLFKTSLVSPHMIDYEFSYACKNNRPTIVELLLKTSLVTSETIDTEFSYACQNNRQAIIKILQKYH